MCSESMFVVNFLEQISKIEEFFKKKSTYTKRHKTGNEPAKRAFDT